MSDSLIALDKQPGVHPVSVRETWRLIISNIVLKVIGPDATIECQDYQMCSRNKAGIDGVVHGFQAIGDKN